LKQQPCCARLVGKRDFIKGDLARIARQAARRPERREHWKNQIKQTRAAIAEAEQRIIDHEAEHAEAHQEAS